MQRHANAASTLQSRQQGATWPAAILGGCKETAKLTFHPRHRARWFCRTAGEIKRGAEILPTARVGRSAGPARSGRRPHTRQYKSAIKARRKAARHLTTAEEATAPVLPCAVRIAALPPRAPATAQHKGGGPRGRARARAQGTNCRTELVGKLLASRRAPGVTNGTHHRVHRVHPRGSAKGVGARQRVAKNTNSNLSATPHGGAIARDTKTDKRSSGQQR